MSALIIAEHDNQVLAPSTSSAISAATKLTSDISILVAGQNCQKVIEKLQTIAALKEIFVADHEVYANPIAENLTPLIIHLADKFKYFLAPATTFGKNLMPRVAAKLDVAQVSDVIEIQADQTYLHPIYAGNALEKVRSLDEKQVLTIRPTAFSLVNDNGQTPKLAPIDFVAESTQSKFIREEMHNLDRPQLNSADIVIAGGRGLKDEAAFARLMAIADRLGAAVGASRAAVDGGLAPNDFQVGQTGQVVAPKLYIAVGISGAIQHLAGMKDSKTIVAINKDPEAPIFQVADYALIAEIPEVLTQWEEVLKEMGY